MATNHISLSNPEKAPPPRHHPVTVRTVRASQNFFLAARVGVMLGCWDVGMLGCWDVGMLGCWDVGMLGCWDVGMLVDDAECILYHLLLVSE
jgi:hypothetical protein